MSEWGREKEGRRREERKKRKEAIFIYVNYRKASGSCLQQREKGSHFQRHINATPKTESMIHFAILKKKRHHLASQPAKQTKCIADAYVSKDFSHELYSPAWHWLLEQPGRLVAPGSLRGQAQWYQHHVPSTRAGPLDELSTFAAVILVHQQLSRCWENLTDSCLHRALFPGWKMGTGSKWGMIEQDGNGNQCKIWGHCLHSYSFYFLLNAQSCFSF